MPTRKTRAGTPLRTRRAKDKLVELCLDMEDALDQVVDVAHALRLIGHGLGHDLRKPRGRRRRLDRLRTARHLAAGLPQFVQIHVGVEMKIVNGPF
jgi:hypothetical protein